MGHSYIFLLIIMQEKLIYFQKMTSCKLRVTFSELFVEEYRKNRLMGRSVILRSIVGMTYSTTSSISSSTKKVLFSKIVTFDF